MRATPMRLTLTMLTLVAAPAALGLELGDPAPELRIQKWVQGKPLSLEAERGKNVVVVDFFSVVCHPATRTVTHLNDLHRRYQDRDVKFVSVSGDGPDWIEMTFLPRVDHPDPNYRVAHDDQYQTTLKYLAAAGVKFVPHAFVIGREGRIAWHGTPDQRIDAVIETVIAGDFDIEGEKKRRIQRAADWASLVQAVNDANLERAEAALRTLEPLESEEYLHLALRYVQSMADDNVGMATFLGKIALIAEDRPKELNEWAWGLLTDPGTAGRYAELACHVAQKAHAAAGPDDYMIADTLALAMFETGRIAEAVKLQKHALELAEKHQDGNIDAYRKALAKYEKALSETR